MLSTVAPEVLHESPISQGHLADVQQAMRGVITKGTAAPVITTQAVEIAGKTGTSETGVEGQWHSWFAAYGPYETDHPEDRVVVVVMAEASPHWEWWAPKAANLIFQGIFAEPDLRAGARHAEALVRAGCGEGRMIPRSPPRRP